MPMSMQAYNRPLPEWFTRVETGQLMLPRIQRFESWSHGEVVTLLDTVLRGHPIGAALVLNVGDEEKFVSRLMSGVAARTERTTEHLLDGQQRLTALWKALNDKYDDRTYFAVLEPEVDDDTLVRGVSRWLKNGQKFPLWADQPKEQLYRGLVPIRLLNPSTGSEEIGEWCDEATESVKDSRDKERVIGRLQANVKAANIPFLALPVQTPRHVAIDVFIKMNTTSVQLNAFDIAVAQMEAATGDSLHDLVDSIRSFVPAAERYLPLSDLVLRVAALREDRSPTEASFERLDLEKLSEQWSEIEEGVAGAVEFLTEEFVFDRERLPTIVVLPVLAAIWSRMPQALDAHGHARTLLRQYLWRAFFTTRYERAAATAALQDYRGLATLIGISDSKATPPIFSDKEFPLVQVEEIEKAPWPRLRNTLARGILAVSLRGGGRDFADDKPASWDSLQKREYHHLFPAALLRDDGGLEDSQVNLALNCALVTWNTNRHISAKEPIAYLKERVARAALGEPQIRSRVSSHTIPFEALNVGGYSKIDDVDGRASRIRLDYQAFIRCRAEAIHKAAVKLCNGQEWHGLNETNGS